MQAVADFDVEQSAAWRKLESLATQVFLDDLEVDPAGIVITEREFRGVINLYVLLKYGSNTDNGPESAEAFRGIFRGELMPDGLAHVTELDVNVEPFFA